MKKMRKRKTIKSRLSCYPVKELNWRDNMLELLLLGSLVNQREGLAALVVFQRLQSAAAGISSKVFDGSVSAWNALARGAGERIGELVETAPDFFAGAAGAMFRRLPLEGRELLLSLTKQSDPGADPDSLTIARLVQQMWDRRGATATKAKALHLWAILKSNERASPDGNLLDEIKGVLDGSISIGYTSVRASWGAFVGMSTFQPSPEWAIDFRTFGMTTPCIRAPYDWSGGPPWPLESLVGIVTELDALIATVLTILSRPSFHFVVSDVLGGLLARLRSLLGNVLSACERDEGEPAEIFLRCLADTNITIRWMLSQEDWTIFLKYKERSYEQEKHAIDTLRSAIGEAGPDALKSSIDREYSKLHKASGRWPELMDVTLGPWNDLSIARMAKTSARTTKGSTRWSSAERASQCTEVGGPFATFTSTSA